MFTFLYVSLDLLMCIVLDIDDECKQFIFVFCLKMNVFSLKPIFQFVSIDTQTSKRTKEMLEALFSFIAYLFNSSINLLIPAVIVLTTLTVLSGF